MLLLFRCFWLLLSLSASVAFAAQPAADEWKDPNGKTFRGDPAEVLGPLALWRVGSTGSKYVPLRALSPEDCARFYRAIAGLPERAAKWSDAQGRASAELVGRLLRVQAGQTTPVDFDLMPEPELFLVLFGSRKAEGIHEMLNNLGPFIARVQRVYPGRVATVLISTSGRVDQRLNLGSLPAAWTWYAIDPKKEEGMKVLGRFVPPGGFVMMLMTRHGVPLYGGPANNLTDLTHFVDGASDMLWQINPANPRTAHDRAHYLKVVRPLEFAERKTGPLLLSDLFKVEGLRRNGIARIEAKIDVASDGFVTGVQMLPTAEMPPALVAPLTEVIRKTAMLVPAIDHGTPVEGSYEYSLTVGPANPQLAADAAWVTGDARVEVPLKSWLVLKPIKVPEQVFGGIDRVGGDGTVMMKAVTAGDASKISTASQMNSFNSDWFSELGGPSSVRPNAGDKLEIDGVKLTWKPVKPYDGLVDFMGGAANNSYNYCIGYAWTEIESPDDRDAWLGIGSDDGLKVWHNGELVNDKWLARQSRLDDDVVPLKLKKGKNQFLIKIQNVKGIWSFTARLRTRAG